jgi:hypothetical protein
MNYIQRIDNLFSKYKKICSIGPELLNLISSVPDHEHKEKYIHEFLDSHIDSNSLLESFDKKLVFVYDEAITTEIFISIHNWFLKKCCNIKNILFVSTLALGLGVWYQKYLELFGQTGFMVVEVPLYTIWMPGVIDSYENLDKPNINKELSYYFDFYGGTYGSLDRDFLVSLFLTHQSIGHVDYLGGFSSDTDKFDGYLEQLTNFCDRKVCDQLIENKKLLRIVSDRNIDKTQVGSNVAYNSNIHSVSACQIIRETVDNQNFSILTEKTLKGFLNLQFIIPLGFQSIRHLENLGFLFAHDLIDYGYQEEPNFYKRALLVNEQVNKLKQRYSLKDLEQIILDRKAILMHNYDYIVSGKLFEKIYHNVQNLLND